MLLLLRLALATAQFSNNNSSTKVLIETTNSRIARGIMTSLSNDTLKFYNTEGNYRSLTSVSLGEIARIKIQNRTGFINGFKYAFIGAEAAILTYYLTSDGSSENSQTNEFLISSATLGLPAGILGGLSGMSPRLNLEITDSSAIRLLGTTKLNDFQIGLNQIALRPKDVKTIASMKFDKCHIKRHQLNYTPLFYLSPGGIGRIQYNVASEIWKAYKSAFNNNYHETEKTLPLIAGISISPWKWIELQYRYISRTHSTVGLDNRNSNSLQIAGYDFYTSTNSLLGLYRPKYFSQCFGKPFQIGLGAGISRLTLLKKGYLAYYDGDINRSSKFEITDQIYGIQLLTNVDYFLSNNFSIRLSGFYSAYKSSTMPGLMLENYQDKSLSPVTINPKSSGLIISFNVQI